MVVQSLVGQLCLDCLRCDLLIASFHVTGLFFLSTQLSVCVLEIYDHAHGVYRHRGCAQNHDVCRHRGRGVCHRRVLFALCRGCDVYGFSIGSSFWNATDWHSVVSTSLQGLFVRLLATVAAEAAQISPASYLNLLLNFAAPPLLALSHSCCKPFCYFCSPRRTQDISNDAPRLLSPFFFPSPSLRDHQLGDLPWTFGKPLFFL